MSARASNSQDSYWNHNASQQHPVAPQQQYVPNDLEQLQQPTEKKASRAEKFNVMMNKISKPINKAAAKLGSEAFSPQTLDLEIEKAARILRSFCIEGFYSTDDDASQKSNDTENKIKAHGVKRKALRKIPPSIIQKCTGLAIFTSMRMGWSLGGGNGCGILLRHLPDGSWSAPSGIHMACVSWGLVAGVDIYDCIAVINTESAMESFTQFRGSIGAEVAASVGPLGAGQIGDMEVGKGFEKPVWTYTKSRGLYLGASLDGTVFIERTNENPRFYGKEGIKHAEILSGSVKPPEGTCDALYQTLDVIEGKRANASEPAPPSYESVVKS